MKVQIGTYGNYNSGNYGCHCQHVIIGTLSLYFSYKTIVAFSENGETPTVVQNSRGVTTGKHLKFIDDGDKKSRIPQDKFEEALQAVMKKHDLEVVR